MVEMVDDIIAKFGFITLITMFILIMVGFALLPELMNSAEQAKSNTNVTGTQGIFIDLVGLFMIISIAVVAFAISTRIKLSRI